MKFLFIPTIFMTVQLFANYAFTDEKTVKIDMHGGNTEKLSNIKGFSKLKEKGFGGLRPLGINKPKEPIKPEEKEILPLKNIQLK